MPLALAGMVDRVDPHPTRAVAAEEEPASPLFDQDAAAAATPVPMSLPEAEPIVRRGTGPRRIVPFVVAAALVLMIALGAVAFAQTGGSTTEVPGVVGLSLEQAEAQVDAAGFSSSVDRKNAPDPAGTVIAQSPASGSFSDADSIRLTVSDGPALVGIPNVDGTARADAAAALTAAGFTLAADIEEYSDTVAAGTVIDSAPKQGEQVAPDSQVTLSVSKGRAPVEVPDVRGRALADAQAALEGLGFEVTRGEDEFSNDVAAGQVMDVSPAPGETIAHGSTINLVVSKGPDLVTVPYLIGQLLGYALADLQGRAASWSRSTARSSTTVRLSAQSVAGNAGAPRGSAVVLRSG